MPIEGGGGVVVFFSLSLSLMMNQKVGLEVLWVLVFSKFDITNVREFEWFSIPCSSVLPVFCFLFLIYASMLLSQFGFGLFFFGFDILILVTHFDIWMY